MSEFFDDPVVFAAKYNDEERVRSQSGGLFAVMSDVILENGGAVYGCVFDKDFQAVHIRAVTKEERNSMRYSKYVQSNMLSVMHEVEDDLLYGREVLFSGTSCQVSGLKSYIGFKDKNLLENLYCVDVVCHGVPSPMVWRDYLLWESNRVGSGITAVLCRNKQKYGWHSHVTTIQFDNGSKVESRVFPRIFYGHNALRPACSKCPYKSTIHPGDVTIGDYWGIEKAAPDFEDDKGVSIVLINNQKGMDLFDRCRIRLRYKKTSIKDSMQTPLMRPYDPPKTRERFWKDYSNHKFLFIAKKYGSYGLFASVKRKMRSMARRVKRKLIRN